LSELQRPANARPRGGEPAQEPPTPVELDHIERQLALLPTLGGATAVDDERLHALLVSMPGRGPGYNFAACPRWPAADSARLLHLLTDRMLEQGEWPAIVVADGLSQPATLPTDLAAAGWVELEGERIYVTRRQPGVPHLDPALRLEGATPASAAECQAVEQAAFGLSAELAPARARALAAALERGALRAYMVRLGGRVVASARLTQADGVAGVSGVGVLPDQRGKGFGSLVTAVATRAGLAMGNRLVWLSVDERNQAALRLYRRLGYQPSFDWTRWAATRR
jgi:ribosomal protein S18 acetylase RimI-like enzyme